MLKLYMLYVPIISIYVYICLNYYFSKPRKKIIIYNNEIIEMNYV